MTAAKPAWNGKPLRIDPHALPARYTVPTPGSTDAAVYLDTRGVVVKRRLSGLPLTLSLPIAAYEGVAVRLTVEGALGLVASVELMHRDPQLCLPLAVTRDIDDAACDWRAWSDALSLPMYLIEADGRVVRVQKPTEIALDKSTPRRRIGMLAHRRPRFLVRRRVGKAGPMPVLTGWREIIAPE
ncbi:DUF6101 family protein [Chthonobacter albigriseus]|uniref:DUF6101 family protein n=1 Tax=Chthonobacter albigriseus TaxID=1683161 RepID=UPI0015EE6B9B|nr:DUF6101 family protein [Chthonobacter albigriseus]